MPVSTAAREVLPGNRESVGFPEHQPEIEAYDALHLFDLVTLQVLLQQHAHHYSAERNCESDYTAGK